MSYLRSIKKKILNLSSQAGIYQFLNYKGDILYIGKAKNLKKPGDKCPPQSERTLADIFCKE